MADGLARTTAVTPGPYGGKGACPPGLAVRGADERRCGFGGTPFRWPAVSPLKATAQPCFRLTYPEGGFPRT